MQLNNFIEKFAEAIEDESVKTLSESSNFREMESWDSLAAMSVMAMIDQEYNVSLTADEMLNANTFNDLIDLIKSKKENA